MKKTLSQITFDFNATDEAEETAVTSSTPETPKASIKAEETTDDQLLAEPEVSIEAKESAPSSLKGKRGRRSLKENDIQADLVQIPDDEQLFKKQYYAIGEVAIMFNENQSLIRYWETEFDILQPRKNRKGDRFFRPVDVKNLVLIYDLLRRRKFTIEGAKDYLKKNKKAEEKFVMIQSLQKLKGFLLELKANL